MLTLSYSRVGLFANPINCSPPGSSVYGSSQVGIGSGLPFPSLGDLSNPGIEPESSALAGSLYHRATWEAHIISTQSILNTKFFYYCLNPGEQERIVLKHEGLSEKTGQQK